MVSSNIREENLILQWRSRAEAGADPTAEGDRGRPYQRGAQVRSDDHHGPGAARGDVAGGAQGAHRGGAAAAGTALTAAIKSLFTRFVTGELN
eukprot:1182259-Prorocentrum_minimum.AAC.1